MTTRLLIRIPDELANRLRRAIASGHRSAFIRGLIEDALPDVPKGSDRLYRVALAVEADGTLLAEMAVWDGVAGDGLDDETNGY